MEAKAPEKIKTPLPKSLRKGWLKDIPLMSPSGIILLILAVIADLVGWIPFIGFIFKALFFIVLYVIAKPSLKSLIAPIIIEEIPIINFLPTFIVKLFF